GSAADPPEASGSVSDDDARPSSSVASASTSAADGLTQPNPAVAAGTAMVPGLYRCYVRDGADPAGPLDPLGSLLDVRAEPGWYVWDGQPGSYTMTRSSISSGEDVWGDVTFQSGPLQNVQARSSATFPAANPGVATTAVVLFRDGSGRNCATGG
nr:hypothetical protein [Micromonospora sp. DSM 115978]